MMLVAAVPGLAVRTLTDELNRTVVVPDHPHRIICLVPAVADAVFTLGAGADVVGVSDFSEYPEDARHKPSIGQPLNPSLETIVSLRPDLIVGDADFGANLKQVEELGIPVFLIEPHGLEGIFTSLLSLGNALNREAAANAASAGLRARVSQVQARVRAKPVLPIFMLIWHDPVTTIGARAFVTDLIAAAGGESVTKDLPNEWVQLSFERVVALAPKYLLLVRNAQMSFEDLSQRPGWSSLPAIRERHVFYADDRLYSPSPVAIDALEELAKQFHP